MFSGRRRKIISKGEELLSKYGFDIYAKRESAVIRLCARLLSKDLQSDRSESGRVNDPTGAFDLIALEINGDKAG